MNKIAQVRAALAERAIAAVLSEQGMPVSSPDEGDLDDVQREQWEAWVAAARAFIEMVRERAAAMLKDGCDLADFDEELATEVWRAIIAAAEK